MTWLFDDRLKRAPEAEALASVVALCFERGAYGEAFDRLKALSELEQKMSDLDKDLLFDN